VGTDDLVTVEYDVDDGRTQLIHLRYIDAGDISSVIFTSPFADVTQVSAGMVLRATEDIMVGVRIVGGFFAAHHEQLIALIDDDELNLPMFKMAHDADQLARALGIGDRF